MKKLLVSAIAAAMAVSFAVSAQAAAKQKVSADVQASCKAQAAKKFSAVHFLKRRAYVKNCVARHEGTQRSAENPKAKADEKPSTTGAAQPQSTTGPAANQSKKQ
jgi:hypothetical protein